MQTLVTDGFDDDDSKFDYDNQAASFKAEYTNLIRQIANMMQNCRDLTVFRVTRDISHEIKKRKEAN